MITIYCLTEPLYWIIPWILQSLAYFFILRKMGLKKWTAVIPFLAERQFTKVLFRKMRTFYRPFVIAAILGIAAYYLDPAVGMGRLYMWVAYVVYGIFLIRLYWRLGKSMGKGKLYRILMILLPPIFLIILGLGKAHYEPLMLKPRKQHSKPVRFLLRGGFALVSIAEVLVIVAVVGFFTIRTTPPVPLVGAIMSDTYNDTKDITDTGEVVTREDAMGNAASTIQSIKPGREHFFPSHENDKNVVVAAYIIGSNLEDKNGLASINIRQMVEATKQGNGLTFVLEAGGSKRWFTREIESSSVGRYIVKDGKVTKVQDLPEDTCMAKEKPLADFLSWTKEQYPADRYMLVLWDHGGGVPMGYGHDDLNERTGDMEGMTTMRVSEVVNAVKKSGITFDIIGFDACLMQDIEIATAFEPYADYYLGSEEVEGGFGWFYTHAFGRLASNPGMSSEEFGRAMIACYDPYNTVTMGDGDKPITTSTLSFVDLALAAPAYQKLEKVLGAAGDAVVKDPMAYADMAGAASSAYAFQDNIQIDLIGFLKILDKMDYDEDICSHEEKVDLIRSLQASVLYRNGASAKGINGISFAFPYKEIYYYKETSAELKKLTLKTEKKTFDRIFSIMAAQQKKDLDKKEEEFNADPTLQSAIALLNTTDYTEEPWYIKGFEDYDQAKAFIDIPLEETAEGYRIQLPKKAWKLINDCQTIAYQKVKSKKYGTLSRYLGTDHIGSIDADGNPMVSMDDNWVHIDGRLVCYEAEPVQETDEGEVFTGKVKARLNDTYNVKLKIEWDAVKSDSDAPVTGHVVGFDYEDSGSLLTNFLASKGPTQLEAGDTIEFLFDYYDEEGNLVTTKPVGKRLVVTKQDRLTVTDEPLGECDITFGGALTDIYQRVMTTEQIEMHLPQ